MSDEAAGSQSSSAPPQPGAANVEELAAEWLDRVVTGAADMYCQQVLHHQGLPFADLAWSSGLLKTLMAA